ncbi:hypothetical protein HBF18_03115 [Streptococcus pneumoniae]|nr:hypothetical protein [Streptococcus pneumoniae]NMH62143.1 hypothetical protein [Streptococcus pneumoniae]HEV9273390.1 hypothetical protein [Streptococcus pneumoniae]
MSLPITPSSSWAQIATIFLVMIPSFSLIVLFYQKTQKKTGLE